MSGPQDPAESAQQHQNMNPSLGIQRSANSSPLSEPVTELGVESAQAAVRPRVDGEDGVVDPAVEPGSTFVSIHATSAEDKTQSGELALPFECPHCDKAYAHEQSLKRHMNSKRSVCMRVRGASDEGGTWACPRCRTRMTKRYSADRHIKDSCWKVCDECCENGSADCDAFSKDGPCAACDKAGKLCTKYTEALPDCNSTLLTCSAAETVIIRRKSKADTLPGPKTRSKRTAAQSPTSSPSSKPKPKHKSRGNKKGQVANRAVVPKRDDHQLDKDSDQDAGPMLQKAVINVPPPTLKIGQPKQDHNTTPGRNLLAPLAYPPSLRPDLPPPPQAGRTHNPHPPSALHHNHLAQASGFHNAVPGPQSMRMLPPMPDRSAYGAMNGTQYARSIQEVIQLQLQAVQGMGLASPYAPEYGNSGYPVPTVSSSRSSLHLGQHGWGATQLRDAGPTAAQSILSETFQPHQTRSAHQMGLRLPVLGALVPRTPSRQPSMTNGQLSAANSRVPTPQQSVDDGQWSAPGSRVPSRQVFYQSSTEDLRSSMNSAPPDQRDSKARLIVKLPLSRELNLKLSLKPAAPIPPSTDNPTIHIRIHSNVYDPHGLPIFSILSLRMHDPFGPRLAYYCTQRGVRFNTDWKFLYRYPAPTREKPTRQKFFDIVYAMTPAYACDCEYPAHAMTSGSTILVVTRCADATSDDDVGEQVPCQRVMIQNGETEVYQAKSVNGTWYRDAEHQLTAACAQMGNMRNGIAALERENAALRGEVEALRSPYHQQQQQQVGEEDAMRQYVARYHGQLHAGHVDRQQQRDEYVPGSMEHYLLARRYPVRRQGPGAKVALGDGV